MGQDMPEHYYEVLRTSRGWLGVLGSAQGIRRTTLPAGTREAALAGLGPEVSQAQERPGAFARFHGEVEEYFQGRRSRLEAPLDLSGAPEFFRRAWQACRSIPAGETRSYGWLAVQAGRPGAARAAGQAMARNPVPLVVPCHRVVGSDGHLHGFGGGLPMKAWLLSLDQGTAPSADSGQALDPRAAGFDPAPTRGIPMAGDGNRF